MRYPGIFLILAVIACLVVSGCTQSALTSPVTTTPPAAAPTTGTETPAPVTAVPTVPEAVATATPQEVVTIVHQISLTRDMKKSDLLFSLQVPVEWSLSTQRIENPENFEGAMYQTDLRPNNSFYIHTFTNYRNREQNYRDDAKRWVPAPNESVVKINGLTFDRYESTANGMTNVSYVMRNANANEFGYISVLTFSADASDRFAVEDYDRVVKSFRYFGTDQAGTVPGEEITMILPEPNEGGSVRSAVSSGGGSSSGSSSRSSGGCPNRR